MDQSLVDPILDKIRIHRKRAEYHKQRADEWELVLAQIQALQRQEQPSGKTEQFSLALPKPKEDRDANRFVFARNVLRAHSQDGILPVEIRRLANEQGFSCPTNYPYKLLTNMVKQGTARKDEAGRYYPVVETVVQPEAKRNVRLKD
jgi:hypothetical protein